MSLAKEFRCGIADVPLAFGQDCKALVAVDDIEPLQLAFAVASMANRIQQMVEFAAHGTGKLSTDRLKAIEIPVPPADLQARFVEIVQPMRQLVGSLRDEVRLLMTARDLLLPKLISGEVDVTDLDIDTSWLAA
jgi:type I restriction enzyme S subunit